MTRRARAAAVAVALAGAGLAAPAARADDFAIGIPSRTFSPGQVNLVPGDRVTWRNGDFVTHEVHATDGSFDSGLLTPGSAYSRTFTSVGHTPFLCPIHPFMTGEVDVRAATQAASAGDVVAGTPVQLHGRVPAGTASVTIERKAADGSWQEAGSAAPAASGAYAFTVRPAEAATFRARTDLGPSPEVAIDVVTGLQAGVRVRRSAHHVIVQVAARPATAGLHAVLERYARWHFAWRGGRHVALGKDGKATFTLPARARGIVRVTLRRGPHGTPLAESPPVRLRDGRRVADPLGGMPHGGPAHAPAGDTPTPHH
jgi:plastocyanin